MYILLHAVEVGSSQVPLTVTQPPEKNAVNPFKYLRNLIAAPLVSIAELAMRNALDKELDASLRADLARAILRSKRKETGELTLDQIMGLKSVSLESLSDELGLMKPNDHSDKLATIGNDVFHKSPEFSTLQTLTDYLHLEATKRSKKLTHEDLYVIRSLCAPQIEGLLYEQYVIGQTAPILLNQDANVGDRVRANLLLKYAKSRQAALLGQVKAVSEMVISPPNKLERIMRKVDPYMGGVRPKIDLPSPDQIKQLRTQFSQLSSSSYDRIFRSLIHKPTHNAVSLTRQTSSSIPVTAPV